MRTASESRAGKATPLSKRENGAAGRRFRQRLMVGVLFVCLYVLLDRTTVYFQMWSGISCWYPPSGLAMAVFLGIGFEYLPFVFIASLIASKVNYHQPTLSYSFLLAPIAITAGYLAAAQILRRVVKIDCRLRSVRDVVWLLFLSMPASGLVAFLGTLLLVLDHGIPGPEYVKAAMNWWVGDAVALASVTPFLLVYVIPWLRRYTGTDWPIEAKETKSFEQGLHESRGVRRRMESMAFGLSILAGLWVVLSGRIAAGNEMFYLLFLPITWMAVRRGLRGATVSIMTVDLGIVIALRVFPRSLEQLTVFQFLMLVLSLAGLTLGAVISEKNASERHASEEEERIRLLLESAWLCP